MLSPPLVTPQGPLPGPPSIAPYAAGVSELVRWASQALLRGRWDPERVRAGYCTRSPAEILADGTLAWTAPCADLSSLTAIGLAQAGLRPTLVLTGIRRPLQPVKFQCGLEVELEGRTHVIGFALACAYFYPGTFVETRRRPWILRRPLATPDPQRPFLAWFEPGARDAVSGLFPGYDLERDLRLHSRTGDSLLRYLFARRKARSASHAARGGRLPDSGGRWL